MSELLDKIDKAEGKLSEFKKLAAQVYKEANADGVIDAEEKKEIAAVAQQIKGVQEIVQGLKDEYERNKAQWESLAGNFATFNTELGELISWGKPDIKPVESKSSQLAQLIAEKSWKAASEFLETAEKAIKPLMVEYLVQKVAKEAFEVAKTTLETALAVLKAFPIQSDFIKTTAAKLAEEIANTATDVADFQFSVAKKVIDKCVEEMKEAQDETKRLEGLKTEFDDIYKGMRQRLVDAKDTIFKTLELMLGDITGLEDQVIQLIEGFDYDEALKSIKILGDNLVVLEKDANKIDEAKKLYEERLEALRSELLDASMCSFPELDPFQKRMAQIRARMDAAANGDNYEQALLEMDELVRELDAFNAALTLAIAKQKYREKLATLEPQIFAAAVSNYGPLVDLANGIATDHEAAESMAASEDYEGAIARLESLEPKLDQYFTQLPQIERDEALYNGQIGPITDRFTNLSTCEYPQLTTLASAMIVLHDEMIASAETGDFPAAVMKMQALATTMLTNEMLLEAIDIKRAYYEDGLAELQTRLETTLAAEFAILEKPFAAIVKDRDAMLAAATALDFITAADLMAGLLIKLDGADLIILAQNILKERYEAAFEAIKDDLKTVATCDYPELVSKQTNIITLSDAFVEQAKATQYFSAYTQLLGAKASIADFIKQEAVCADFIRRRDLAKDRVTALDEITFKTLDQAKTDIKTAFEKLVAEAMTGEVITALEKLIQVEKDLKAIEDANQQSVGLKRAFDTAYSDLAADVKAVLENENEAVDAAEKLVKTAYEEMKRLGDDDKFEEGIRQASAVKDAIADFYSTLDAVADDQELFEALKKRTKANLDTAETRAKDFPETLDDPFEKLKSEWETIDAEEVTDFDAAKEKLAKFDIKIDGFDLIWRNLGMAEAAYKTASDTAIARYKAFPKKEAEEKAEREYAAAKDFMDDMVKHAEKEEFVDAMEDLTHFKSTMDEIDEALKTEAEHNAEYDGRHDPLKEKVDALGDSPHAAELTSEKADAEAALAEMEASADRRDYETAMKQAKNVDAALERHNDAEDVLEQAEVADKAKFDGLMEGMEPRYKKAIEAEGDFIDDALEKRISDMQAQYVLIEALANAEKYDEAYDRAKPLRPIIDKIVDDLAAAELAAANERADEAEDDLEDEKEKDIWDFLEEEGKQIIRDTGKKLMDEAVEKIGGPIEDIYDLGNSLYDLKESVSDGDIEGIISNGLKSLKNGFELHPGKQAYKRAINVLDTGYEAYKMGKKVWNLL